MHFKFLNGTMSDLAIPKVWTFKKVGDIIAASSGIDAKKICMIFEGRKMDPRLALMDEKNMARGAVITVVIMGDAPAAS